MNIEFIARANIIVLELEKQGLNATAAAMRQVVTNYEFGERQAQKTSFNGHRLGAWSSS